MDKVKDLLTVLATRGIRLSAGDGRLMCYAPKESLTSELKTEISRYKSDLIALLSPRHQAGFSPQQPAASIGAAAESGSVFPLSVGAHGLYLHQKLMPGSAKYNVPICLKLVGDIDIALLRRAWDAVIDRFPILMTRVIETEDVPALVLDHGCRTTITEIDPDDAGHDALIASLRSSAREPFDPGSGPLVRADLHRTASPLSYLLVVAHHMIFDGHSGILLLNSLLDAYRGLSSSGRTGIFMPSTGYSEYVAWERSMLASSEGKKHADFWEHQAGRADSGERLVDLASGSGGFADVPGPLVLSESIDADVSGWIRHFSRTAGATPSAFFLAAFAFLFRKYTSAEDVTAVMPVSLREGRHYSTDIGYFVNVVPVRVEFNDPDESFPRLLARVQNSLLDCLYHAAYPYPLIRNLSFRDGAGAASSIPVGYAFQDFLTDHAFARGPGDPGPDVEILEDIHQEEDSEFGLQVYDKGDRFVLRLSCDEKRYGQDFAATFFSRFLSLLRALFDSGGSAADFSLVPAGERHRLLREFNGTPTEVRPSDVCAMFAEAAKSHADLTAVVSASGGMTYREIDERSQQASDALRRMMGDSAGIVGLCIERSADAIVGLLAILRAGHCFLPLDPAYPDDRLAYMLGDSRAAFVIAGSALLPRLQAIVGDDVELVAFGSLFAPSSPVEGVVPSGSHSPETNACLIYTSGSTGQPKGVLIGHAGLANHNLFARAFYGFTSADSQLQCSSMSFDLFLEEVLAVLASGAKLVVASGREALSMHRLAALTEEHGLTALNLPTALFHELASSNLRLPSLRKVIVGGERLDHAKAQCFLEQNPQVSLFNTYGPTETTIISTAAVITLESLRQRGCVTIGTPIANTRVYILDRQLGLQPIGFPGEICIAGVGVSPGYLGRPDMTRERFVEDPFVPGARMYRTGDKGRWLQDGSLEYLGRMDDQVKIRGFRVEPGEVEEALGKHPGIESVVVVAQGELSSRRLVAFYMEKADRAQTQLPPTADTLRAFVQPTLPEHLIPSFFVLLDAIPLTPNGKIDRRRLERIDAGSALPQAQARASTDTERNLIDVWADVLRIAPSAIGVDDDFFALGGHSLLATQVLSRIRETFAVDIPIKTLFERSRIAELAMSIDTACASRAPAIRPVQRQRRMPLSYSQERIWFIHRMEPDGVSYNVPGVVRIQGSLDIDRLEHAFRQVIERHESLRTVFFSEDGIPFQRVLPEIDFRLSRFDLGKVPALSRESSAKLICRAEATTPFDLECGPLIRARIVRLAEDDHMLMVNMHHIVSDGWSIGILIEEIGHHLAGNDPPLPPLPIQYVDFSVWQRDWLDRSGELERQLDYWAEMLAGVPELLELPSDFPRPGVLSHVGETCRFAIGEHAAQALHRVAERERCTLFMVLLAAVNALLHRYTGQEDICIGTPVAGRSDARTERLIGMFVNTLAIRTRLHGNMTFSELLSVVKATCLSAYDHQDAPFEKVIETLRPKRNMAITPVFQVMVMLQNADADAAERDVRPYPIETGVSKFDLSVEFEETANGLAGAVEYSTALFRGDRIVRMIGHLKRLCDVVAADPSIRLKDIDFLGMERQRLLNFHQGLDIPRTEEESRACMVHRWFAAQAAGTPDAIAVEAGEHCLGYDALDRRANRIAHGLIVSGVGLDDRVAICMERGIDMVAGLLGILKAGAAYVPLEPGYPAARLAYLLEDSAPKAFLTQCALLASDVCAQARAQQVVVHAVDGDAFDGCPDHDPLVDVQPHHLAYVIYTSGSTGRPKGVMIEHAGLTHYLCWAVREYADGGQACDSIVSSPIAFDATVTSLYLPLLTGGRAVLLQAGDEIAGLEGLLRSGRRWDLLKITPLHWRELGLRLAAEGVRCDVGRFVVGGEALPASAVEIWRQVAPAARCINEYGPTETVVGCTIYDVPPGDHDFVDVPIGRPIDNTRIYILDDQRRLQPIGVPGELYIAGAGVARGYLDRPDLTAERFLNDPFVPGARMYRSGDLARWSEAGVLEYLGRIDTQVKVRGFRIELGEIEAALCRHPGIESAAVVTQGTQADRKLVAFYTMASADGAGEAALSPEGLKDFLHASLPDYMVPAAFRHLEAIPQTPSGKVDRPALERMQVDMESTRPYQAPRNQIERDLLAIWSEVLQRPAESIGVNDDFFELGGHSLLAVRIVTKAKERSGKQFPLSWLISAPTIAQFATMWTAAETAPSETILVPIETRGGSAPLFAVPGAGGNVLSMADLSRALGAERAFYGLQALGLDGRTRPLETVEETAKANIQAMKSVQAHGPYHLLGHSYGGVVAYEMALQLAASGERVAWLALLDSAVPRLVQGKASDEDDASLLKEAIAALLGADAVRGDPGHGPAGIDAAIATLRAQGIDVGREQMDAMFAVLKANLRCYRRYRPKPMPSDLTVQLYRATRESRPGWPADYGWGEFLASPPSLHDLDADHFSLLGRVQAHRIARSLPPPEALRPASLD